MLLRILLKRLSVVMGIDDDSGVGVPVAVIVRDGVVVRGIDLYAVIRNIGGEVMENGVVANAIIVGEGEHYSPVIVAAIDLGDGVEMRIVKSDGRRTSQTVAAIVPEQGIVDRVVQGDPGPACVQCVVGNGVVGAEVQ
jgi:hypothetical protein